MIISQTETTVILDKTKITVKGFVRSANNSFESLFVGFLDWLINQNFDQIDHQFAGNRVRIFISLPFSYLSEFLPATENESYPVPGGLSSYDLSANSLDEIFLTLYQLWLNQATPIPMLSILVEQWVNVNGITKIIESDIGTEILKDRPTEIATILFSGIYTELPEVKIKAIPFKTGKTILFSELYLEIPTVVVT
jgi:hypothetical protein